MAAFASSTLTSMGDPHSINPFTGAPSSSYAYLAAAAVRAGKKTDAAASSSSSSIPEGRMEDGIPVRGASVAWHTRGSHNHAGLRNQGATCYLNSLLQALFHTRQFRAAVLAWEGTGRVPRALQRLFARMEASVQGAVETKELTESFGWTGAQAFRQQDVQELLRVLFQVLGDVKDPQGETPIVDALYRGSLCDSIVCSACGYTSAREDAFLDVSLFMDASIGSLEDALAAFVAKEVLAGDNAYACSGCDQRTEASKGLVFGSLPPVLSLQLKRFVFDWETNRRIKLDSRLEFPLTLNMGPYTESGEDALYECYAILLHSGSAHSGHYFAFVKAAHSDTWFEFNDVSVREIDDMDPALDVAFGSNATPRSGSAYLLQYRAVGSEGGTTGPSSFELSQDLAEMVRLEDDGWRAEVEALVKERRTIRFTLVLSAASSSSSEEKPASSGTSTLVAVDQDQSVAHVVEAAIEGLGLSVTPDRVRIRSYRSLGRGIGAGMPGRVLDEDRSVAVKDLPLSSRSPTVVLEVREEGEAFAEWDPEAFLVFALRVEGEEQARSVVQDLRESASGLAEGAVRVWLRTGMSLDEVAECVGGGEGYNLYTAERDRLVDLNVAASAAVADGASEKPLLEELGVGPGTVVYVEDAATPAFAATFDDIQCSLTIEFNDPVDEKEKVVGSVAFAHQVRTSKHKTLGELKAAMGEVLGLDVGTFTMARSARAKEEFKNMGATLSDVNLFDGAGVFLRLGTPLGEGEYRVRVVLYDPCHRSGRMFWPAVAMVVSSTESVTETGDRIRAALDAKKPGLCAQFRVETHMRIRAMAGSKRIGKVLHKGASLGSQIRLGTPPGSVLAIQAVTCEEDEDVERGSLVVCIQQVAEGGAELGLVREITVPKTLAQSSVQAILGEEAEAFAVGPHPQAAGEMDDEREAWVWALKWKSVAKAGASGLGPGLVDASCVFVAHGADIRAGRARVKARKAEGGASKKRPRPRKGGGPRVEMYVPSRLAPRVEEALTIDDGVEDEDTQ